MSHDYTFISDLNNMQGGGMPMQGGGMPMQGGGMPMQGGVDQFDMLRKYLAESAKDADSDSDNESDSEDDSGGDDSNWQHFYGVATLILLLSILYYVFKIRKELTSMYEEA